ncbi:conserved hypothetical protein [Ferrimonas balearica DSM 9799]|uniref:Uncharacterized protein n=2 Tax=Ferrimonas balearica TaxID=44012 RepID=E1SM81_FERBD|nr:conserved hypothetical protein [Ferrimonas balearica DSM 9799]
MLRTWKSGGMIAYFAAQQERKQMATKKRFIAGAQCPECQEQDSVMLYAESGVEVMECVACGYRKHQAPDAAEQKAGGEVIGVFKPE